MMSGYRNHELSSAAFARLVRQAIADLPPVYAKLMDTIAVVVEDEPPRERRRRALSTVCWRNRADE
jgi:predicted Zn-dependent protease with MMP-like domain